MQKAESPAYYRSWDTFLKTVHIPTDGDALIHVALRVLLEQAFKAGWHAERDQKPEQDGWLYAEQEVMPKD